MKILVRRTGALGDVCDTTPVFARLRKENPDAEIDVETDYPYVFEDSPHKIGLKRPIEYDKFIDLNMSFENNLRRVGTVQSYMETAFGDREGSTQLIIQHELPPGSDLLDWPKIITIHPARSWPHRTLPYKFWLDLINILIKRGWGIIVIGTAQDWPFEGKRIINTQGQLIFKHQLGVIGSSRLLIASESGPLFFAQATDVPILGLLTMGERWIVEHDRQGQRGWGLHTISADIPCTGCSHRFDHPLTWFDCPRGDHACVYTFDPETVADKAEEILNETTAP